MEPNVSYRITSFWEADQLVATLIEDKPHKITEQYVQLVVNELLHLVNPSYYKDLRKEDPWRYRNTVGGARRKLSMLHTTLNHLYPQGSPLSAVLSTCCSMSVSIFGFYDRKDRLTENDFSQLTGFWNLFIEMANDELKRNGLSPFYFTDYEKQFIFTV